MIFIKHILTLSQSVFKYGFRTPQEEETETFLYIVSKPFNTKNKLL